MSDSIERLYQAVIAARDLDPATSRTARLFQRGPAKMAKKLAEEAVEVVIDAISGKDNTPVTIVQWLRFGAQTSVRVIGSSPRTDWEKAFPRFRAVRDGIQPRG